MFAKTQSSILRYAENIQNKTTTFVKKNKSENQQSLTFDIFKNRTPYLCDKF